MIAKSALLTEILKKADALSKADGKSSTSVDYVMIVVLDMLDVSRKGEHSFDPEELAALESLLAPYSLDLAATSLEMKEYVKHDAGAGYMDMVNFGKMTLGAESKATRDGKDVVGADLCLQLLLESPTAAILRYILHKDKPEKPAAVKTDGVDLNFLFGGKKSDGDEEEETESPAPAEAVAEAPSSPAPAAAETPAPKTGSAAFAEIVEQTKHIQEILLQRVYGQDHAIATFASGYFQGELSALTQEGRTAARAVFLFAGPPGVGKTFLAEQAADILKLPKCRYDMSEYADGEAVLKFCGFEKTYKYSKEGTVTGFVQRNPRCVLIFDEIEKASLSVLYLFLQLLDAGRVRDNYTQKEVSFKDAILIFTTNAGRQIYEDSSDTNLSSISPKAVIRAIAADVNPTTGAPYFPGAICSRFAAGNVILFNNLGAHDLVKIVDREFRRQCEAFTAKTNVKIDIDKNVPYALMFSEGGHADARMIRGKSGSFIYRELYELYRLVASGGNAFLPEAVEEISFRVELPSDPELRALFGSEEAPGVLLFADERMAELCKKQSYGVEWHVASDIETAKELFTKYDIRVILCDILCDPRGDRSNVLNLEDTNSSGRDFFLYASECLGAPVYLLQEEDGSISPEELLSFSHSGARGAISVKGGSDYEFGKALLGVCSNARQQKNLFELARANKVVKFQTAQRVSADGKQATVSLYDLQMGVAVDAEDKKNILSGVSKPDVKFADVIGAEDAKEELSFFVDILKNPVKYARRGIRTPKGALLYGPPGTGKTLLAKAMAGESGVTFIAAEGNQFLKKYLGEGPEHVHKLFATARKYAPAILFVDEIDAIAKARGSSDHAEHTADVLTSFLTEMDGFRCEPGKPVFVLAATNYDIDPRRGLDAALLRRFDRKILVDLPNKDERKRFLALKMQRNPAIVPGEEELENIAVRSTGMSLADLDLVIDFALRSAFRTEDGLVTDAILEEAFETYVSGEEKKWDASLLRRTAYHEAGHAYVCYKSGETPSYLTIVARSSHGGYMQHGDNEDKALFTKEELLARIRTALGGRAAEVVIYGDADGVSTGASGDLATATYIAEQMICAYGMDECGLGCIDAAKLASSPYYEKVHARVNEILNEQFEAAKALISEGRDALERLVDTLIAKSHLKGDEIEAILRD